MGAHCDLPFEKNWLKQEEELNSLFNGVHLLVKIILSAAAIPSLRGQGTIYFRNASRTPDISAPVTDARNGQRVEGNAWTAQLYYTEGVVSDRNSLRAARPITHRIYRISKPHTQGSLRRFAVFANNPGLRAVSPLGKVARVRERITDSITPAT
jgi:hypothetical protein